MMQGVSCAGEDEGRDIPIVHRVIKVWGVD